jgi:hypothetical protein
LKLARNNPREFEKILSSPDVYLSTEQVEEFTMKKFQIFPIILNERYASRDKKLSDLFKGLLENS